MVRVVLSGGARRRRGVWGQPQWFSCEWSGSGRCRRSSRCRPRRPLRERRPGGWDLADRDLSMGPLRAEPRAVNAIAVLTPKLVSANTEGDGMFAPLTMAGQEPASAGVGRVARARGRPAIPRSAETAELPEVPKVARRRSDGLIQTEPIGRLDRVEAVRACTERYRAHRGCLPPAEFERQRRFLVGSASWFRAHASAASSREAGPSPNATGSAGRRSRSDIAGPLRHRSRAAARRRVI